MIIKRKDSAEEIVLNWDNLTKNVYQKRNFLTHLEIYNPCNQRYYVGYREGVLITGAVVYSLKINVLTFATFHLNLPMTVIGIPASVDSHGLVGDPFFFKELISTILKNEKGIIICLNYDVSLNMKKIIEMSTLPTLIFDRCNVSWQRYIQTIRHSYRRRILKAEKKFSEVSVERSLCAQFTDEHYKLYVDIMQHTKTKLETLSQGFFSNLPKKFILHSYFAENQLLTWHITTSYEGVYYFLFGGINYSLRDKYDSYYNNLIQIIKEAIVLKNHTINLGQTAEISKNRLGARLIEKRMFLFHKNILIWLIFRLCRSLLSYKTITKEVNIYKKA